MNRRDLLRTSFAVGAVSALSASRVMGANDRVRMGLIGSGGRGREDWGNFLKQPDIEPVAVCDVYDPFRDKGIAMTEGRAKGYKDFRQLLGQKDIDAVIIATPDHWHSLMTIAACEAGKDVYCEKPLTLFVSEGRKMVEAVRKHKRVAQTGSQQRSGSHYAQAVKLIQDGGIGEVHRIHAGFQRNIYPGLKPTELASGLTLALDWEMWLGPAPKRAFDPFRCIYNFRWFWDYSGGQMTNWGAHHLDIARWIVGAEAPSAIAGFGGRYALTDGGETPDVQQVTYQFPKTVVTWTVSEIAEGKPFTLDIYGTKGMLTLLRSGFHVVPEMIAPAGSKEKQPAMEALQSKGGDLNEAHARNFLDCVKSRQRPNADIEEGHRSAVMCHLGNISSRLGRSIKWDAAKEQVIGDVEANQMLSRPYRAPWRT
jgi:predicted dehydrogenase